MNKKFKLITLEDLKLTPAEMRKIAEGAQRFLKPEEVDTETETETPEPLITKRPIKD